MNRRNAMRWLLAGGFGAPGIVLAPQVLGQAGSTSGKVLVTYHVDGGLDQSSFADPRGDNPRFNDYAKSAIGKVGNFRIAPMGDNIAFFRKYAAQILVINGIDCQTNDHEHGSLQSTTGTLDGSFPTLCELFANRYGPDLALSWLNQARCVGESKGAIGPVPLSSPGSFRSFGAPNQATSTATFIAPGSVARMQLAQLQRAGAILAGTDASALPQTASLLRQTLDADAYLAALGRLAAAMPTSLDGGFEEIHLALLCVKANLASAIQLVSPFGFDSHADHLAAYNGSGSSIGALKATTDQLDYFWTKAKALGVDSRITLFVESEFGRGPLNAANGKDHHPCGTAMVMSSQSQDWTQRVFGASGPEHEVLKFKLKTGAVDAVNGLPMTMRSVHAALRRFLDIAPPAGDRFAFSLTEDEIPALFDRNASTPYL